MYSSSPYAAELRAIELHEESQRTFEAIESNLRDAIDAEEDEMTLSAAWGVEFFEPGTNAQVDAILADLEDQIANKRHRQELDRLQENHVFPMNHR
jgi:hypothetical protein